MKKFNKNRIKSIAKSLAAASPAGRAISMFYGDPVEVGEEQVADVINQEVPAQDAIEEAAADAATTEEQAAERVNAYTQLSRTERSEVTIIPPLSLTNAVIVVKPVVKGLSANNLNYLLQKAMVDYPSLGKVKIATAVDPDNDPGHYVVEFNASDYSGEGLKAMPFFRFNLSASTLNARPGGNYNIWIEGVTENGQSIETEPYTFQRIENVQAVLGIMVPFRVIATRTLPALGIFGTGVGSTPTFKVHITGMDPAGNEVFSVTHPGYSTAETKVIAELFALPAGLAL